MERFRELDAEVWLVSVDAADKLQQMRESMGLTMVNLMDPESETIKRYGILNQAAGKIPHPAALVIGKQGIVHYIRVDENYTLRPPNEEILQALRALER